MLVTKFSLLRKSDREQDGDGSVHFGNAVLHHYLTDLPSAQEASAHYQEFNTTM